MKAFRQRGSGFTLVELMIVLGIIAILAAIALPSYTRYALRARRTDAQKMLLAIANAEERYYAQRNVYADLATIGYASSATATSDGTYYTATVAVSAVNSFAAQAFTATAVPASGSPQLKDVTACKSMTITNTGLKAPLGTTSNGTCW